MNFIADVCESEDKFIFFFYRLFDIASSSAVVKRQPWKKNKTMILFFTPIYFTRRIKHLDTDHTRLIFNEKYSQVTRKQISDIENNNYNKVKKSSSDF